MPPDTDSVPQIGDSGPKAESGGRLPLLVYSVAAALGKAMPLPLIDGAIVGAVRGAALRRVATRRGVRLTREARDLLSADASPLHGAVARVLAPLRPMSRFRDALSTYAAAILLDHYLATAERPPHAALSAAEARRFRSAMSSAAVGGVAQTVREAPRALSGALGRAARAAGSADHEDRRPLERMVDALLDAAADAPADFARRLCEAFDRALADEEASL